MTTKQYPRVGTAIFLTRPDGTFLMQPRDKGQRGEGCWSLPGGKLEIGESIRQAAIREAYEETGIRVQGTRIVAVTEEPPWQDDTEHWITFWLKSEGRLIGSPLLRTTKSSAGQWIRWGNWPQPLWQPYWDNLFDALNSERQAGILGGLPSTAPAQEWPTQVLPRIEA